MVTDGLDEDLQRPECSPVPDLPDKNRTLVNDPGPQEPDASAFRLMNDDVPATASVALDHYRLDISRALLTVSFSVWYNRSLN